MKCLHKEPRKRYASAQALAEDSRRFLDGMPIHARPVNALERGWRWCRRKPALASALLAVVLSLLVGTLVATAFAVQAQERAEAEAAAKEDADRQREKAFAARDALAESNDRLLTSTARSLLRPLGLTPSVTDVEMDVFEELAQTKEERLRVRFIEQALRKPLTIRQLRLRDEFALQAAVGLDVHRRDAVERLFVERLTDAETTHEARIDLCLCLATLGGTTPKTSREVALALTKEMETTTDFGELTVLADSLERVAPYLSPQRKQEASNLLIRSLAESQNPTALRGYPRVLVAVTSTMSEQEASAECRRAAEVLIRALTMPRDTTQRYAMWSALLELTAQISSEDARKLTPLLIRAILSVDERRDPNEFFQTSLYLAEVLQAVMKRIVPKQSREAVEMLTTAINETDQLLILYGLTKCLGAVVGHLEPTESATVCAEVASKLSRIDPELRDRQGKRAMSGALEVVAKYLDSEDAKQVAKRLIERGDWTQLSPVVALAHRLNAEDAGALAELLPQRVQSGGLTLRLHLECLTAVGNRLPSGEAKKLASAVLELLPKSAAYSDQTALVRTLEVYVDSLAPEDANEVCNRAIAILIETMRNIQRLHDLREYSQRVAALCAQLPVEQRIATSSKVSTLLLEALTKAKTDGEAAYVAEGLGFLASTMEPSAAERACAEAAEQLCPRLVESRIHQVVHELTRGLTSLAPYLDKHSAKEVADCVWEAFGQTKNPSTWFELSKCLTSVLARLDPSDARIFVEPLSRLLNKQYSTNNYVVQYYSRPLSVVASRLRIEEVEAIASTISDSLRHPIQANVAQAVAENLLTVLEGLDPSQRVAILLDAIAETPNHTAKAELARGLTLLTPKLEAEEAIAVRVQTANIFLRTQAYDSDGLRAPLGLGPFPPPLPRSPTFTRELVGGTATYPPPFKAPLLPPLPASELVELLAHPLCVEEARRSVLDSLGIHYQRKFVDQWDFVRFAKTQ